MAEEKFKSISAAYTVLSDEKQKQMYDQFGEEGLNAGGFDPMHGMDPSDLFSQVFGLNVLLTLLTARWIWWIRQSFRAGAREETYCDAQY